MANCHKNFFTASDAFHSKIILDNSKRDKLIGSRDGLRSHIRARFEEKERPKIKFKIQGSFHNETTVNPLNGDYDIDDGIYFDPPLEQDSRPTPETVHSWVKEAADSYKQVEPAVDKRNCVRVPFKAGYHVDFPIYDLTGEEPNRIPELAIKGKGWKYSDPREFGDWFDKEANKKGALRRLVRYFKAWSDYQGQTSSHKMPSGMVFTILATEEFQVSARDDEAFAQTASAIHNRLLINQSIKNPVDRSEDLRKRISDPQFNNFIAKLDRLVRDAETALEHESAEEAAKMYWQKQLGDRFPVIEDEDGKGKGPKTHGKPGIVGVSSGSA